MTGVTVVTGASGFLGRAVLRALPATGVLRLRRTSEGGRDGDALPVDLRDPSAAEALAKVAPAGPVRLIHLAGAYRETDLSTLLETNVAGVLALLDGLGDRLVHVTFASSVAVYGNAEPRRDESGEWIVGPDTAYGRTKWLAEQALSLFARAQGVPVAILRIASVYGPGNGSANAVEAITRALVDRRPFRIFAGGRAAARDYVYVDDVARAVATASAGGHNGTLEIGSGRATTAADLAVAVRSLGEDLTVVEEPGAAAGTAFACRTPTAALGLPEPVGLADGLRAEIEWRRGAARYAEAGPR